MSWIYEVTDAGPNLSPDDWWALSTLVITTVTVALTGVLLFLKRLSLLGDALSHAVLPGVIGAVILVGSLSSSVVLLGALGAAVASIGVLWCFRRAHLAPDAALGVTFTTFFALGVLGIPYVGSGVDVDLHCLLYGALELTPFDTVPVILPASVSSDESVLVPRAFVSSVLTLLSFAAVISIFRRVLVLDAFEPQRSELVFSRTRTWIADGAFLIVASAAIVNSFFAVGAVATTGALAMPVVIARTVGRRLSTVWFVTAVTAVLLSFVSYLIALHTDMPVAGSLTVCGLCGVLVMILVAPKSGILSRSLAGLRLRIGIAVDDHLGDLFRSRENPSFVPGPRRGVIALIMWLRGLITFDGRLTWKGATRGASIVRAHRLWEEFLARELKHRPDHVHELSHRMEHFIDKSVSESIAARLQSEEDPHGRPIPKG